MTDVADRDDDAMLAAEFALRLLDDEAARAARARALTDPGFAAEVRFWQERLAGLAEEVAPVPPSPAARRMLLARLFGSEERRGWWRAAGLWQAATALSLVAAAGLGWLVLTGAPAPRIYAADLVSADASLRVLAVYDSGTGQIRLTRTAGGAPVPLGVLPDSQTVTALALPGDLAAGLGGLMLAISDEPDGGSPTGQPTGPVLAAGPVAEL